MKKTLQLLKGAVGKDSTINIFKCVHLYGDRIQAQNGRITIDAPCAPLGDFTVDADRFIKAVTACDGTPEVKITPAGKLSLKKGSFKALLPLSEHDAFPRLDKGAEGVYIALSAPLLSVFAKLLPMCAEDDNRVWLNGINMSGGYAYATDGTIMARSPVGFTPETAINIPADAIAELVRMGIEPVGINITESAITFDLGDVWMRAHC